MRGGEGKTTRQRTTHRVARVSQRRRGGRLACLPQEKARWRRRAATTRAILRATLAVAHTAPGAILQAVCQELKRACQARYVCIHLVHPELLGLAPTDAALTHCPACDLHPSDRPRLAAAEQAFFTRALEHRAPLEVADCVGVVPHLAELARATGFTNGLAVPLAYRAEVFGLVGIYDPDPNILTALDAEVLEIVGGILYAAAKREAYIGALERLRGLLERYLAPQVVYRLLHAPETLHAPAQELEATVLFSDIRGYTSLAERLAPPEVAELIAEHLGAMTEVVFGEEGTVMDYFGDGLLAIFGAPFPQVDHPERAVRVGLAMQARQRELQARWRAADRPTPGIGVGIHTGPLAAGDFGTPRQAKYMAVGDTVNLAARLTALAVEGQVLISEATYSRLASRLDAEALEPTQVKGKAAPVRPYAVRRLQP
jgi:class 3 adenylate cyclase